MTGAPVGYPLRYATPPGTATQPRIPATGRSHAETAELTSAGAL